MYRLTKKDKRTRLEQEIDSVIEIMSKVNPDLPEYAVMADNLERLYKAKEREPRHRVSPDTIAIVAGNLAGIVLILGYERLGVITSKALGFVLRGRV